MGIVVGIFCGLWVSLRICEYLLGVVGMFGGLLVSLGVNEIFEDL